MAESSKADKAEKDGGGAGSPSASIQMGIGTWLGMLARHRFLVSPRSIPSALYMTAAGLFYGFLGAMQGASFKQAMDERPMQAPIFIIGHWRSGTTLLHEMLCTDPLHYYPTTYACMNPHHFLLTQQWMEQNAGSETSVKRPMDNMQISADSPQEDEFALLGLGAPSPYEALLFPKRLMETRKYFDTEELPAPQREKWEKKLLQFMKQISIGKEGRLIVKSPTHTFRLGLLARMFPDAHFIHIVRNPYEVFASTCNLWKKLFGLYGLNKTSEAAIEQYVIDNALLMEECVEKAEDLVGPDNYHRIKFEDLTANPEVELEKIYRFLNSDGFEANHERISAFLAERKGYKKNRFVLSERQKKLIASSWPRVFEKYDYGMEV